jgi:hypothetical protein
LKNAIRVAHEFCEQRVNEAIESEFRKLGLAKLPAGDDGNVSGHPAQTGRSEVLN